VGSTSLTVSRAETHPLGSAELVGVLLEADRDVGAFTRHVEARVEPMKIAAPKRVRTLVGFGSALANGALYKLGREKDAYDPWRPHGYEMTVDIMEDVAAVAVNDPDKMLDQIDPKRRNRYEADVVAAGLLAIRAVVKKMAKTSVLVSAFGTRYGAAQLLALGIPLVVPAAPAAPRKRVRRAT
jgi:exopolyphosphatase/pppGpp-phosphohydrolase